MIHFWEKNEGNALDPIDYCFTYIPNFFYDHVFYILIILIINQIRVLLESTFGKFSHTFKFTILENTFFLSQCILKIMSPEKNSPYESQFYIDFSIKIFKWFYYADTVDVSAKFKMIIFYLQKGCKILLWNSQNLQRFNYKISPEWRG